MGVAGWFTAHDEARPATNRLLISIRDIARDIADVGSVNSTSVNACPAPPAPLPLSRCAPCAPPCVDFADAEPALELGARVRAGEVLADSAKRRSMSLRQSVRAAMCPARVEMPPSTPESRRNRLGRTYTGGSCVAFVVRSCIATSSQFMCAST